jgi:hypothetical protein
MREIRRRVVRRREVIEVHGIHGRMMIPDNMH